MICKVCGKEGPQTIGGICSNECLAILQKQDSKTFRNELHELFLKYANEPFTLSLNDIEKATKKGLDELKLVW
jgi:hypothetical protein